MRKIKTYSVNGELVGKIMIESVALRLKTNSYLIGNGDTNRKANVTKKYVIKQKVKSRDYKNCLEANQLEREINT